MLFDESANALAKIIKFNLIYVDSMQKSSHKNSESDYYVGQRVMLRSVAESYAEKLDLNKFQFLTLCGFH